MPKIKWTEDKTQFLIDNYNTMSIDEISTCLNISKWTIYEKVKTLGIGKKFQWNDEKIEILKEYYPIGDWNNLFEKLGTNNKQCIMDKACFLGIHIKKKKWTSEEEQYLIDNYSTMTISDIAKHLNRSESAIMTRGSKLKLTSIWSDNDFKLLKELYPIHSNQYLAENVFIGKSAEAIRTRALSLGLHKSKDKGLKKYYDKELILQQLKDVSIEIGRTPLYSELCSLGLPSSKTFERLFGSYRTACLDAGLEINCDVYGNAKIYVASDNTICLSYAELIITEYLIKHNLSYHKELYYKDFIDDKRCKTKRFDWKVGDYFIEYFGMMNVKDYKLSAEDKIRICQENNIKLIELYPKDLRHLDNKLNILLN